MISRMSPMHSQNEREVHIVVLHSGTDSASIRSRRGEATDRSSTTSTRRPRRSSRSATSPPGNQGEWTGPTSISRSTSLSGPASPRAVRPEQPDRRHAVPACNREDRIALRSGQAPTAPGARDPLSSWRPRDLPERCMATASYDQSSPNGSIVVRRNRPWGHKNVVISRVGVRARRGRVCVERELSRPHVRRRDSPTTHSPAAARRLQVPGRRSRSRLRGSLERDRSFLRKQRWFSSEKRGFLYGHAIHR